MRIAICDDYKQECESIKNMIHSLGVCQNATVDSFENGNTLLSAHSAKRYDIILMDVDMPNRTGIEIGKQLRINDSDTILIFVTSYPQYAIEAFDCDAFHYLLKPVCQDKFEQILSKAINKQRTLVSIYDSAHIDNSISVITTFNFA